MSLTLRITGQDNQIDCTYYGFAKIRKEVASQLENKNIAIVYGFIINNFYKINEISELQFEKNHCCGTWRDVNSFFEKTYATGGKKERAVINFLLQPDCAGHLPPGRTKTIYYLIENSDADFEIFARHGIHITFQNFKKLLKLAVDADKGIEWY